MHVIKAKDTSKSFKTVPEVDKINIHSVTSEFWNWQDKHAYFVISRQIIVADDRKENVQQYNCVNSQSAVSNKNNIVTFRRRKKVLKKTLLRVFTIVLMDVLPNLCCSRINFMKFVTEQSVLKYDESCKLIRSENSLTELKAVCHSNHSNVLIDVTKADKVEKIRRRHFGISLATEKRDSHTYTGTKVMGGSGNNVA